MEVAKKKEEKAKGKALEPSLTQMESTVAAESRPEKTQKRKELKSKATIASSDDFEPEAQTSLDTTGISVKEADWGFPDGLPPSSAPPSDFETHQPSEGRCICI